MFAWIVNQYTTMGLHAHVYILYSYALYLQAEYKLMYNATGYSLTE